MIRAHVSRTHLLRRHLAPPHQLPVSVGESDGRLVFQTARRGIECGVKALETREPVGWVGDVTAAAFDVVLHLRVQRV